MNRQEIKSKVSEHQIREGARGLKLPVPSAFAVTLSRFRRSRSQKRGQKLALVSKILRSFTS